MNEPETLQLIRPNLVRRGGRNLTYFGGCDYFRLASHPKILAAVGQGMSRFGLNVAASRMTTGNHALYPKLEKQLAKYFGAEAALLTSNGYVTNLIVAQALAGGYSHVLMDARSHAALQDAAQLFNCPVLMFKHRDVGDFRAALNRCGRGARPALLTDGMFSHDGSVAPLAVYLKLLPVDALLVVDDAHGAGTLGGKGRGAIELEKVSRLRVVQCVTLSKAFGVYGGAVICSRAIRAKLLSSHMFIGSTPLPLPLANAVSCAIGVLQREKGLRRRLNQNADFVKDSLRAAGVELPDAPGPIVPVHVEEAREVTRLKRALLAAGILPPFVNYLAGDKPGYFRFVISSEHTRSELNKLVLVLKKFPGGKRAAERLRL